MNLDDVRNLKPSNYRAKYRDIPVNQEYRVGLIKEIVEIKNQQLEVVGFNDDELDYILHPASCLCLMMLLLSSLSESFLGVLPFCRIAKWSFPTT